MRQTPKSLLHLSTERTGSAISFASSPSSSTISRIRAVVSSSPFDASFVLPGFPSLSGLYTSVASTRPAAERLTPSGRNSGTVMNSFVLQSSSRMITSWATSTRRRVR